jgi:CheY-like chemotaxis protein
MLPCTLGIIEMHGGKINAFSAGEGTGSTFYIDLPLYQHDHPSHLSINETTEGLDNDNSFRSAKNKVALFHIGKSKSTVSRYKGPSLLNNEVVLLSSETAENTDHHGSPRHKSVHSANRNPVRRLSGEAKCGTLPRPMSGISLHIPANQSSIPANNLPKTELTINSVKDGSSEGSSGKSGRDLAWFARIFQANTRPRGMVARILPSASFLSTSSSNYTMQKYVTEKPTSEDGRTTLTPEKLDFTPLGSPAKLARISDNEMERDIEEGTEDVKNAVTMESQNFSELYRKGDTATGMSSSGSLDLITTQTLDLSHSNFVKQPSSQSIHQSLEVKSWDQGLRILIVDDSTANRKMLRRLLVSCGHTVSEASDGLDCLEKLNLGSEIQQQDKRKSAEPLLEVDVILMDEHMPRMNGPEATRLLRQRGFPDLVIALTGSSEPEDTENFLQNGAEAVFTKPLNVEALRRFIDTYYSSHP